MTTPRDPQRRAQQQKQRRMDRRACGHCGSKVEALLAWGGQTIAICDSCKNRLGSGQAPPESGYRWGQLLDLGP